MTAAVVTMSHLPLIGRSDPNPAALHRIYSALGQARDFVADFEPELVVLYVPDHYNGFFHKTMPQFCLGVDAYSVGDFGSRPGPLLVDTVAAELLAQCLLDRGIDPAISARMPVDHGLVQPTEILFGGIDRMLVVPVFINGVAAPFGLPHRIRSLGLALGQAARELQKQVLFVGSGGLSNDPPMPSIMSATQRVAEPLIEGHPTPEQRARIEHRVLVTGVNYRTGVRSPIPINPHWDNHVLDAFQHGTLDEIDRWSTAWMGEEGGGSAHEVRTWIVAYASLSATGSYHMTTRFYEPVPEWVVGFSVTTALESEAAR
ncbi:3-carboxyethylcatechol 2,3-dioxygenase [Nocardia abscessus]|uniref:3-carboxyethylcatechol 2,3-dioxygenase n=1 Tax=Nocardia abscessus TaxID=120957 RepID=UPI00245727B4|nr:3-carboxyethylcatechol 2,3-dioxygenase [Nocardia abscessus]